MSTHNLCFEQKYEKYESFFIGKFSVFGGEIFDIFEYSCFRNDCPKTSTIPFYSLLLCLKSYWMSCKQCRP